MDIAEKHFITRFRNAETEEYISEHITCCTKEGCVNSAKEDIGDSFGEIEDIDSYYQGNESISCDYCGFVIGSQ